jgi:hypothetical protein
VNQKILGQKIGNFNPDSDPDCDAAFPAFGLGGYSNLNAISNERNKLKLFE